MGSAGAEQKDDPLPKFRSVEQRKQERGPVATFLFLTSKSPYKEAIEAVGATLRYLPPYSPDF
jgi:hypothetical protein